MVMKINKTSPKWVLNYWIINYITVLRCQFTVATVTNYHKFDLKQQKYIFFSFFTVLEARSSKLVSLGQIKVSTVQCTYGYLRGEFFLCFLQLFVAANISQFMATSVLSSWRASSNLCALLSHLLLLCACLIFLCLPHKDTCDCMQGAPRKSRIISSS